MQKRKYRINPICPNCGEEHCCWTITLSEEEQETLDNHYRPTKNITKEILIFSILYMILKINC